MSASRRIEVRGSGGPDVLHVVEGPIPIPGRGQVVIRVQAAGVAYGDVMRRRGVLAPPWAFTPGYDVVGRIATVGRGVDPDRVGQCVGLLLPGIGFGGYAEHVIARATRLVPIPTGLDPVVAVALGLNYVTAWQILHRQLRLPPGASLLVHGAAGGVGTALVELGRQAGLTLYGTASAPKHEQVRARGAEPIDYRAHDFVDVLRQRLPQGLDAVTDGIGGNHLLRSRQVLRRGGALVFFGVSGDVAGGMSQVLRGGAALLRLALDPRLRLRLYGFMSSPASLPWRCRQDWARLLDLGASGELAPAIGARIPLLQAAQAHDLVDRAAVVGKVVLTA